MKLKALLKYKRRFIISRSLSSEEIPKNNCPLSRVSRVNIRKPEIIPKADFEATFKGRKITLNSELEPNVSFFTIFLLLTQNTSRCLKSCFIAPNILPVTSRARATSWS